MDEWLIGVTVGSGVVFKGSEVEAREHMNAYVAHLEGIFKSHGLAFIRKEHTIRMKGAVVPNDESVHENAVTNGNGLVTE